MKANDWFVRAKDGAVTRSYMTEDPRSGSVRPSAGRSRYAPCQCCPYGYHIDVDFIDYLESARAGARLRSLHRLHDSKRTMRENMESAVLRQDTTSQCGTPHGGKPIQYIPTREYSSSSENRDLFDRYVMDEVNQSIDGAIEYIDRLFTPQRKSIVMAVNGNDSNGIRRSQTELNGIRRSQTELNEYGGGDLLDAASFPKCSLERSRSVISTPVPKRRGTIPSPTLSMHSFSEAYTSKHDNPSESESTSRHNAYLENNSRNDPVIGSEAIIRGKVNVSAEEIADNVDKSDIESDQKYSTTERNRLDHIHTTDTMCSLENTAAISSSLPIDRTTKHTVQPNSRVNRVISSSEVGVENDRIHLANEAPIISKIETVTRDVDQQAHSMDPGGEAEEFTEIINGKECIGSKSISEISHHSKPLHYCSNRTESHRIDTNNNNVRVQEEFDGSSKNSRQDNYEEAFVKQSEDSRIVVEVDSTGIARDFATDKSNVVASLSGFHQTLDTLKNKPNLQNSSSQFQQRADASDETDNDVNSEEVSVSGHQDESQSVSVTISPASSEYIQTSEADATLASILRNSDLETIEVDGITQSIPYMVPDSSSSSRLARAIAAILPRDLGRRNVTCSSVKFDSATLSLLRHHIAASLEEMRRQEKLLKSLPLLQVRISVLREEKRLLKLQLMNERINRKSRADNDVTSDEERMSSGTSVTDDNDDRQASVKHSETRSLDRKNLSSTGKNPSATSMPKNASLDSFTNLVYSEKTLCDQCNCKILSTDDESQSRYDPQGKTLTKDNGNFDNRRFERRLVDRRRSSTSTPEFFGRKTFFKNLRRHQSTEGKDVAVQCSLQVPNTTEGKDVAVQCSLGAPNTDTDKSFSNRQSLLKSFPIPRELKTIKLSKLESASELMSSSKLPAQENRYEYCDEVISEVPACDDSSSPVTTESEGPEGRIDGGMKPQQPPDLVLAHGRTYSLEETSSTDDGNFSVKPCVMNVYGNFKIHSTGSNEPEDGIFESQEHIGKYGNNVKVYSCLCASKISEEERSSGQGVIECITVPARRSSEIHRVSCELFPRSLNETSSDISFNDLHPDTTVCDISDGTTYADRLNTHNKLDEFAQDGDDQTRNHMNYSVSLEQTSSCTYCKTRTEKQNNCIGTSVDSRKSSAALENQLLKPEVRTCATWVDSDFLNLVDCSSNTEISELSLNGNKSELVESGNNANLVICMDAECNTESLQCEILDSVVEKQIRKATATVDTSINTDPEIRNIVDASCGTELPKRENSSTETDKRELVDVCVNTTTEVLIDRSCNTELTSAGDDSSTQTVRLPVTEVACNTDDVMGNHVVDATPDTDTRDLKVFSDSGTMTESQINSTDVQTTNDFEKEAEIELDASIREADVLANLNMPNVVCGALSDPIMCDTGCDALINPVMCDTGCDALINPVTCDTGCDALINPSMCDTGCDALINPRMCDIGCNSLINPVMCDTGCDALISSVTCDTGCDALINPSMCDTGCDALINPVTCDTGCDALINPSMCDSGCEALINPVMCDTGCDALINPTTIEVECNTDTRPNLIHIGVEANIKPESRDIGCDVTIKPLSNDFGCWATIKPFSHDVGCDVIVNSWSHDVGCNASILKPRLCDIGSSAVADTNESSCLVNIEPVTREAACDVICVSKTQGASRSVGLKESALRSTGSENCQSQISDKTTVTADKLQKQKICSSSDESSNAKSIVIIYDSVELGSRNQVSHEVMAGTSTSLEKKLKNEKPVEASKKNCSSFVQDKKLGTGTGSYEIIQSSKCPISKPQASQSNREGCQDGVINTRQSDWSINGRVITSSQSEPCLGAEGDNAGYRKLGGRSASTKEIMSSEKSSNREVKEWSEGLSLKVLSACRTCATWLNNSTQVSSKQLNSAVQTVNEEWFELTNTKESAVEKVRTFIKQLNVISNSLVQYVINMTDRNGNTALHYAVSNGNVPVIGQLLDTECCDVSLQNRAGCTALMLAVLVPIATEDQRHVIKRLTEHGALDASTETTGQTALMLAAGRNHGDAIRLLLDAGCDVNARDSDGSTALMCASEHGHMDLVKMLIAHPSCDPSIADCDGSTALSVAMEAGHRNIGVLLYTYLNFRKSNLDSRSTRKSIMRNKR